MPRPSKEEVLIEFVIGLGFIGGLFARAGVDPEWEIIKALTSVANLNPIPFLLISALTTIISLFVAYSLGGPLELFAIAFGFLSGYIILDSSTTVAGTFILILAIIVGLIAASKGS